MLKQKLKNLTVDHTKISPLKEGPYKKGLVKNLMKARREVKVALDKKDKALERKARNKVHKFKKKLGNDNARSKKMGGGMKCKDLEEEKVLYHHN